MNDQHTNETFDVDMIEIDLLDLIRLLWQKLWLIVLAMVLCGSLAFSAAMLTTEPTYTASAMMYVNNSSLSVGSTSITFSSSQLSAAKSLLDVYVIILQSRTTLEAAIEKADLDYTYAQLRGMVRAASVNDTEIFQIAVTCGNPDDAKLIVDTLVDILPERIADIVDGSSVRVVDRAVRPAGASSPSNTRYAVIGVIVGAVLGCAIIILQDLMNTTVRDEEYLKQRYNIPILAIVPDVYGQPKKSYGYKYSYKYGYNKYGKDGYQRPSYYENAYEKSNADAYEFVQAEDGDEK